MAARVRAPHPANASHQSRATTKLAEEPINVRVYRFVKGYPLFSGVNSSQSGNPSHYFEFCPQPGGCDGNARPVALRRLKDRQAGPRR